MSPSDIGQLDFDHPVEPAWSSQGIVQHLFTVGCCKDDDLFGGTEAIHFDQELVQSVGSFVVPSAEALPSFAANGVYLIDEDYRRGLLFGIFEELSDSVRPHTCVQLYELTSGY